MILFCYRNLYVRIWNQFDSFPEELGDSLLRQIRNRLNNGYWHAWKQTMFNIYMAHRFGASVFMKPHQQFIQKEMEQVGIFHFNIFMDMLHIHIFGILTLNYELYNG